MAEKQNTQTAKSAANDIQILFDPKGYQAVFKTVASANERMTSVAVEAGTRSTDIASESAKEAFANIREVSQVRDEVADYGKAYSDFVQKQVDLFLRTAKAYAEVSRQAGTEAADLAKKTGEEAGDKAGSAAKKAA